MIKLPVYSNYNCVPSFEDKRLHFDGLIYHSCPKCGHEEMRRGSDLIYAPHVFKELVFGCSECHHEEAAFKIRDIVDHHAELEKVSDEMKVRFFKKTYVELQY